MQSLLPPNATDLELDIEAVIAERLTINVPAREVNTVETCPVELLPWLAWAAGVSYWNHNWPEQIKRQVIKAAPELHRIKGTKAAVIKALKALNIKSIYREWFEYNGERGTFEISAMLHENITGGESFLGAEQLLELQRLINAVKRGSIHYQINIGFDYQNPLSAPGAISAPKAVMHQPMAGQAQPQFASQTQASAPAALSAPKAVQHIAALGLSLPGFTSTTAASTGAAVSRPLVQFDFIATEEAA